MCVYVYVFTYLNLIIQAGNGVSRFVYHHIILWITIISTKREQNTIISYYYLIIISDYWMSSICNEYNFHIIIYFPS